MTGRVEFPQVRRTDDLPSAGVTAGPGGRSSPWGMVDASIVAERLKITTVATVNRRNFAVVRPGRHPTWPSTLIAGIEYWTRTFSSHGTGRPVHRPRG